MANPNPCKKTRFKTERKEPLTANLSMRIAPSTMAKLRAKDNYREFVRELIETALLEEEFAVQEN